MNAFIKTIKFQITRHAVQTAICFSVILFNLIVSLLILNYIVKPNQGEMGSVGSSDLIALVWMFALGISFFKPNYKYLLSNGVTRKIFLLGNLATFGFLSALWSLFLTLVLVVSRSQVPVNIVYEEIYAKQVGLGSFVWYFSSFFLYALIGWAINLAYYRCNKWMKYVLSFGLSAIIPLLILFSVATNGKVLGALLHFTRWAFGLAFSVPNPYFGSLMMLLFAALFAGFNYLLIRRAPVLD